MEDVKNGGQVPPNASGHSPSPSVEPSAGPTATHTPERERLLKAVGGEERFRRSFDGRSRFPERLAERTITDAASQLSSGAEVIISTGGDEETLEAWQARFVRLWAEYQIAGARCMNWFITGPANFPVERNRKRQETERKRYDVFAAHANGAREWARRRQRSAEKAALSVEAAAVEHAETTFPGGRLVRNTILDRVQLVFDGRPPPEIIAQLKSRAFRWSPREGAWQRQLTRNGIWAAEFVVAIAKATGHAPSSGGRDD